jgi:hypothetical protein
MGALMRAKDWSGIPLGPFEAWPQNDPRRFEMKAQTVPQFKPGEPIRTRDESLA